MAVTSVTAPPPLLLRSHPPWQQQGEEGVDLIVSVGLVEVTRDGAMLVTLLLRDRQGEKG